MRRFIIKQKTIAIRCITDNSKGFGHLSRCLSLGEQLKNNGHNIVFIINKNNSAIKEIHKRKFAYILIPKMISHKQESNFISTLMYSRNYDAIIIDMREYSENLTRQLSGNSFKTILLDDVWCNKVYADMIFNGTITKKFYKYKKINMKSKLFLGPDYFIANKEFYKHKKNSNNIVDKKRYNIVVSMGGSDLGKLTYSVTKSIMDLTNINVKVIIGPFYRDLTKLLELIKNKKHVSIMYSPPKIWKQFQQADVVIANAGSTLFELAIQRVPTICIPAIKHQILYAKEFSTKGFALNLFMWKNSKTKIIQKTLIKILGDKTKRRKICSFGDKIVDGKGLSRTTRLITRLLDTV